VSDVDVRQETLRQVIELLVGESRAAPDTALGSVAGVYDSAASLVRDALGFTGRDPRTNG
jgi:hypothetical protein